MADPVAATRERHSHDNYADSDSGLRSPSLIGISSSPPPNMRRADTSTLSINSTVYGDDVSELSRTSTNRSDPSDPLLQFSSITSLRRLQSISEYNELCGQTSTLPPSPKPVSPQIWRNPPTYPPPSILPTLSDSSSGSGENLAQAPQILGGLFSRRKKDKPPRQEIQTPLPDALSFTFSGVGNNLTLWQKNGHSLIHIKISSWESKRLDLRQTLPSQDPDRSLNIKLIAEGDGWISAIIYRKRVRYWSLLQASPSSLADDI